MRTRNVRFGIEFWKIGLFLFLGFFAFHSAHANTPPPFTLSGSSPSATEVDLSWANPPQGTTSYNVQRYVGSSWVNLQTNYGSMSYNYTSASPGVVNSFRVIANPSSTSSSQLDIVPRPSAPTLTVTPTPTATQVSLSWTAPTGAIDYTIYRKTGSGGTYSSLVSNYTGTTYSNTGLTANTTFYYKITARGNGGTSAYSNEVNATTAPPTVTIASSSSDSESIGTKQIAVTLSAQSATAITVPFSISSSSTAMGGGTDYSYSPVSSSFTFVAGTQTLTQNITLTINNDSIDEDDETIVINLGTPTNATLGSPSSSTFTIIDNDNPPTVAFSSGTSEGAESQASASNAVVLSAPSGKTVTVPFSVNASSTATGGDYSISASPIIFSPGETSKNVNLTIVNDSLVEIDETVVIDLSSPTNASFGTTTRWTYKILDNDLPTVSIATGISASESVTTRTIAVTLSAAYRSAVTVPFSVNSASTAKRSSDYTILLSPLTFDIGQTTKNITLVVYDDTKDESDETVIIDLGTPTNATLGTPSSSTNTIQDNDGPPTVSIEASSSIGENAGSKPISVFLSTVSGKTVTVPYSVNASSTAIGGEVDYWISSGQLSFSPGQTTAQIDFGVKEDALDEDDETVIINLGTPTNATLGASSSCTRTIIDNDSSLVFIAPDSSGLESVSSKSIIVTLSTPSSKAVTVPFSVDTSSTATSGGVDYSIGASPLSFAAGETTRTITLSIINDSANETDEFVKINLGTPTNAILGAPASSAYTIIDNDKTPAISSIQALSSSELRISWNSIIGATKYRLYRSANANGTYEQQGSDLSMTSFTDSNLNEGTPYWYKLSAVSSLGESIQSSTVGEYTQICQPNRLTATANTASNPTNSMKITWMDNSSIESGFILSRSLNGTDSWTSVTVGASQGKGNTVTYYDTGRTEGQHYWYKVQAYKNLP